jgi:hypothetical protein
MDIYNDLFSAFITFLVAVTVYGAKKGIDKLIGKQSQTEKILKKLSDTQKVAYRTSYKFDLFNENIHLEQRVEAGVKYVLNGGNSGAKAYFEELFTELYGRPVDYEELRIRYKDSIL